MRKTCPVAKGIQKYNKMQYIYEKKQMFVYVYGINKIIMKVIRIEKELYKEDST